MKTLFQSLRVLAVLTVLTGVLYPLAVWAVGRAFFHHAAEGSLLTRRGRLVGSALLAQKTDTPRYFSPRPSAGDYATVASGASNLAWTSARLREAIAANEKNFREQNSVPAGVALPPDAVTASGSGLDPDLSLEAVRLQTPHVVAARRLTPAQQHTLDELIARHTTGGHIGPIRINILRLNLALDEAFPSP